jgi:cytochrome c-type biogenesis protein CcmH
MSANVRLASRRVGGRSSFWLVLGLVVVISLTLGQIVRQQRSSASQRIITLEKEVKCLTCIDLSVYNSQGASSFTIRTYISDQVHLGRTNTEILDGLVSSYGSGVLMSPPGGGIDSLLWLLPIGLLVAGGGELLRRRWMQVSSSTISSKEGLGEDEARITLGQTAYLGDGWSELGEPDPSALWGDNTLHGERREEALVTPSSLGEVQEEGGERRAPREVSLVRFLKQRNSWLLVLAMVFLLLGGGIGLDAVLGGSGSSPTLSASTRTQLEEEVVQGELLASEGSDVTALKLFASALKLDPTQPQALTYDGWLLFQAGQRDHSTALDNQGRLLLQEAATVSPSYATVHLFLGLVDVTMDKAPQLAVREFNAMLKDGVRPSLLKSVRATILGSYRSAGIPPPKSL